MTRFQPFLLMSRRKAAGMLAAGALLITAVVGVNSPSLAQGGLAAPIEGSWIFTITRTQDPAASFTSVGSFSAGGVFLATGSMDRVNPVSPLYGSWQRAGSRYLSTTYFFSFDPARPNDPATGMLRTNQVFQLRPPDELVGVGDLSACDLRGENCVPIPAGSIQLSGKRILTDAALPLLQLPLPQ